MVPTTSAAEGAEVAYPGLVPDEIIDDELTELALAAEPFDPFADDVVQFDDDLTDLGAGLLPSWYMPPPSLRRSPGRVAVLAGVAIALFVINVGGLCVTYGIPDPVW